MSFLQWLLVIVIAVGVGWLILQPQRWGRPDRRRGDGGTAVGVDGTRNRDRDDHGDSDGGDGGGGD